MAAMHACFLREDSFRVMTGQNGSVRKRTLFWENVPFFHTRAQVVLAAELADAASCIGPSLLFPNAGVQVWASQRGARSAPSILLRDGVSARTSPPELQPLARGQQEISSQDVGSRIHLIVRETSLSSGLKIAVNEEMSDRAKVTEWFVQPCR
jgi:hypothetical protein